MPLMEELVQAVTDPESPIEYWDAQSMLRAAIEGQERIIRSKEQRHFTLRKGIKRYSENSPGRPQDYRECRQHLLQRLLLVNEQSEENHRFSRAAILYLGDSLAYRLLPDHAVRLHGRNATPGFFGDKKGRELELAIGGFLTNEGWTVLLHDVTHCL